MKPHLKTKLKTTGRKMKSKHSREEGRRERVGADNKNPKHVFMYTCSHSIGFSNGAVGRKLAHHYH